MQLSKVAYARKRIHNGCSVLIESSFTWDNCSASLCKSRDAEQLPSWQKFQSAHHNHEIFLYSGQRAHSRIFRMYSTEALSWCLVNRRKREFISGEQGIKGLKLRETGNIENKCFDFGEQGNETVYFRGTREQVPPPPLEVPQCSWKLWQRAWALLLVKIDGMDHFTSDILTVSSLNRPPRILS